jgi:hypothetical protein
MAALLRSASVCAELTAVHRCVPPYSLHCFSLQSLHWFSRWNVTLALRFHGYELGLAGSGKKRTHLHAEQNRPKIRIGSDRQTLSLIIYFYIVCGLQIDRLCGLVVRVLGYRSGGPGSIPGTTEKKSSVSGTGCTQPREFKLRSYLIEK